MHVETAAVVARWNDPAQRPLFKGKLIDDDGCKCAQGDILATFCGWTDEMLRSTQQVEVDKATAAALGISVAHSILLRHVNDSKDGAPSIVLTEPEKILGPEAQRVLKFWCYLDMVTDEQWKSVIAAWAAARDAARAGAAAGAAAGDAALAVAGDAARATNEIQGHSKLKTLFFLPMFGFAAIADLDAWEPA